MKTALLCLLFTLPIHPQDAPTLQEKVAKFKEAESRAPKGYPTLFVVSSASSQSGSLFGADQACQMYISTLGKIYFVTARQGLRAPCKAFQPGTAIFGSLHDSVFGQYVELLDASESKPKKRTYSVESVQLVDPSQQ